MMTIEIHLSCIVISQDPTQISTSAIIEARASGNENYTKWVLKFVKSIRIHDKNKITSKVNKETTLRIMAYNFFS